MTPLCLLALKNESDKGGRHLRYGGEYCEGTHGYTIEYDRLLSPMRDKVKSLLEIGVNRGCGLRMWRDYFPNAQIIGLDNSPATLFEEERIKCFEADQSDPASLLTAVALSGIEEFDVIIDDGSHQLTHQLISLRALHPFVRPGGYYFIEDVTDPVTLLAARPMGFGGDAAVTRGVGRWDLVEPLVYYRRD